MIRNDVLILLVLVGLVAVLATAAEAPPPAKKGETLLTKVESDQVIAEISERFKANPCLKARIVAEIDDLAGTRKMEGELLLDRPSRCFRKFTKPSMFLQALNGSRLQEYAPKTKKLFVTDFSQAPQVLKVVQAAFTADLQALSKFFAVYVFATPDPASQTGGRCYRVLLMKPAPELTATNPAKTKLPFPYSRIQARIASRDIFFREIAYFPEDGIPTTEHYSDIQPIEKPADEAFTVKVPADVTPQVRILDKENGTP
ncbi:MAG: hypothetical protein V1899_07280 [Planctomycetota bacterium]